jgi:hypothetical protein
VAAVCWGHVGSPNVFFDGDAGSYPVHVVVRPPAVIPGLAEVTVRVRPPDSAPGRIARGAGGAGTAAAAAAAAAADNSDGADRLRLDRLRITAQPVQWDAGPEGAPPPDVAEAVRGETGLYTASLWLMTAASYDIRIVVRGPAGGGALTVPVSTTAGGWRCPAAWRSCWQPWASCSSPA